MTMDVVPKYFTQFKIASKADDSSSCASRAIASSFGMRLFNLCLKLQIQPQNNQYIDS